MKTSTNSAKGPSSSIMSRLNELAEISEQADGLTRRYLSPEHRSANDLVGKWMASAGMSVREDAVGNIIGRYEGEQAGLPAIMVGSHLDTVLNAGRYDGMLGVVTGIDCVASLNRRRVRLPAATQIPGDLRVLVRGQDERGHAKLHLRGFTERPHGHGGADAGPAEPRRGEIWHADQ